jgi:hypothetical protein
LLRLRLRLRFTSTLLGSIRVVPLVDCSPDAWYHEILRAICVGDDTIAQVNSRILTQVCKMMYLFAACETGIRSRSKSSLRRLFNSVSRRNLRSAIDCLFFLALLYGGVRTRRSRLLGTIQSPVSMMVLLASRLEIRSLTVFE